MEHKQFHAPLYAKHEVQELVACMNMDNNIDMLQIESSWLKYLLTVVDFCLSVLTNESNKLLVWLDNYETIIEN